MVRFLLALGLLLFAAPTYADVPPFPPGFETRDIATNGATIHVRIGGSGPAVVLLHGFGETGDMWAPLAADLMRDHRVIVPDLRGLGLSSHPADGYDKKTQGGDVAGVLDALNVERADLVTHDIGNMVGYAFAAEHPDRVTRFVLLDAPLPGVGPWEEILKSPLLWHFHFGGPDMERLVAGRERIYLDRFWNDFSADPAKWDEASRRHYAALYAMPGTMHSSFAQFAAFDQDAEDNRTFLANGKLAMPVLAIGGEASFGPMMATVMRFAADDVQESVIPDAGHWLMEEQPDATVAAIGAFLRDRAQTGLAPIALDRREVDLLDWQGAGAGTSGVGGIQTTVLSGDPAMTGPYAIEIRVPAHTRIATHSHRDDRFAMVVTGEWHFGYGAEAGENSATMLTAGGFYTEPAGAPHFASTREAATVVYITGFGPTDTRYVNAQNRPGDR